MRVLRQSKITMAKSNAQRQREQRERDAEKGLTKTHKKFHKSDRPAIEAYIERKNKARGIK